MNAVELRRLERLARWNDVQLSFQGMDGEVQRASVEVVRAVLKSLGVPAANDRDVGAGLRETRLRAWRDILKPVTVVWDRRPGSVELQLASGISRPSEARLILESGEERTMRLSAELLRGGKMVRIEGADFHVVHLPLPLLPFGYHRFELEIGGRQVGSRIFCAPSRSFGDSRFRAWGIFLPLYAAHSRTSWGAGNFSDWQRLTENVAAAGGKVVAALPLLAAFLDEPLCDPSPYSPVSRLFWNEFYIDAERTPEMARSRAARKMISSGAFQREIARFRRAPLIDYRREWSARRKILELLARDFFSSRGGRREVFERFLRDRPQVRDYARFRAAGDETGKPWGAWPERMRNGDLRAGDYDEAVERFYLYAQWIAQEQIDLLEQSARAKGVKLYLDLPLGVHPDGFDTWRERDSFTPGVSVGAPPDLFFTKGQNWGFPPLHPRRIREQGYRHAIDFLRFQMRHSGLLRLDHIMGLHRLYWIPSGFSAAQGVYVGYRAEEWQAILSLESHRHQTMLVGENLGTVPPEVNRAMKRHRIREMFVVQYEQRPDPRMVFRKPPASSVASLNTHDMPTFAAHWSGCDLADRCKLGLIPRASMPREKRRRKKLNAALARFLRRRGRLKSARPGAKEIVRGLLSWLSASDAQIVLATLEDLWLEPEPQNVPGTSTERPNWRRKARFTIEEIFECHSILDALLEINQTRRATRRRSR